MPKGACRFPHHYSSDFGGSDLPQVSLHTIWDYADSVTGLCDEALRHWQKCQWCLHFSPKQTTNHYPHPPEDKIWPSGEQGLALGTSRLGPRDVKARSSGRQGSVLGTTEMGPRDGMDMTTALTVISESSCLPHLSPLFPKKRDRFGLFSPNHAPSLR